MHKDISTREQQKQDTREDILQAAEQLFLTNNFDSVSTTEIATQSDVAKGTIFHHFGSKDRLAIAVLNRVFKRFLNDFTELKQVEDDLRRILRTFLEDMFTMMIELPGVNSLLLHLFAKMDDVDQSIQTDLLALFEFMMGDFMAQFVDIFVQLGYSNPEIKTRLLFGLIDGLGLQLHFDHIASGSIPDDLVSNLVDEIMSMLVPQEG